MQTIDTKHAVVNMSTFDAIQGAVAADIDGRQVRVIRRLADGQTEETTLYVPAGIRIVRR